MGACIEFDPSHAVKTYNKTLEATMVKDMAFELGDNQLRTLAILIGLNGSDFTYGWVSWKTLKNQNLTKIQLDLWFWPTGKTTYSKFFESIIQYFRWNGYINGLTLFYSHYTDTVEEEIHSIPITPGLTPIAFLQNIEKTYLGHPYTECVPTYSVNRNF